MRRMPRGLLFLAVFSSIAIGCSQSQPRYFIPAAGVDYGLGMMHRAIRNDNLSEIARYYRRDMGLLAYLNGLSPPYWIREGECLYIPPSNDYSVLQTGALTLEDIQAARRGKEAENRARRLTPEEVKSWVRENPSEKKAEYLKTPIFRPEPKPAQVAKQPERKIRADIPAAPPRVQEKDFVWPVTGQYMRGFSDVWGDKHRGVDIAAPPGTAVRAARSGRVLLADTMPGYGRIVLVDHGDGFATLYAHLSKSLVAQGETVKQNRTIGLVGSTGRASGPHLHFEVRYNGVAKDPEEYLPHIAKGSR